MTILEIILRILAALTAICLVIALGITLVIMSPLFLLAWLAD